MTRYLILFCLLFGLISCSGEKSNASSTETEKPPATTDTASKAKPISLKILIDDLRVRTEASGSARVIGKVSSKDTVTWSGEVSDNSDAIKLRGVRFNLPWIKVKTDDGEGWIYSGATTIQGAADNELAQKLLSIFSKGFFGETLAAQLAKYSSDYTSAKTDKAFAQAYKDGRLIRQQVVDTLVKKGEVLLPNAMDMSWVEAVMPGYHISHVAEGTQYYVFADFPKMLKRAETTSGNADDDFYKLSKEIYGYDGGEDFFYSWFEQTWDYGGESLLGQGKHLKALNTLSNFTKSSDLFAAAIKKYKDALMQDLTNKDTQYREKKPAQLKELNDILSQKPSILTDADLRTITAVKEAMAK